MNSKLQTQGVYDGRRTPAAVLMLLSNAYDPDPRVRQEALALTRMGCRVRILAWDRDSKSAPIEVMEGIEVERIFLRSRHSRGNAQLAFYAMVYLEMFWRGLRLKFDAVHCHDLDTLPAGYLLAKLKRKRLVYDSHESFVDMLSGSVHARIRSGLRRLEDVLIRRVDLLITVGEKLRAHFAERGARRTVVVGNWKHPAEFHRTPAENADVRRRLGIPQDAITLVCITQLLKDRKIGELLRAVETCPDVYLVIGGSGVLENMVRAEAERSPRVKYVGFVPAARIPDYTCAADAIFYGFDPENPNARFSAPNKLFEALAAGRPIICAEFGEIGDVIRHSGCGLLVSDYSVHELVKAFDILRDAARRKLMSANAKRCGNEQMNWPLAEAVLRREYLALLPQLSAPPSFVRDPLEASSEAAG